jgi:hypothetical protein
MYMYRNKKKTIDIFQDTFGYSWDYVFVFKVYEDDEELNDDQITLSMSHVLQQLTLGGLDFTLFYSCQVGRSLFPSSFAF